MHCRNCGALNADSSVVCAQCGQSLLEPLHQAAIHQARKVTSGLAIGSLIASISGLLVCLFVGQIIGIVLGHMARKEIRQSGGALEGEGFATAAIIIGWIGIVIDFLVLICMGGMFLASAGSQF